MSAKKLAGRPPAGGKARIVRLITVVAVALPEVPVIVTAAAPSEAERLTVKLRILEDVVLWGLNEAVTPLGRPEAERPTLPEKPLAGFTVMVASPLLPC